MADTFLSGVVTVGAGPVIVYGIPKVIGAPVHLSVVSGSVKDYVYGVLGTGRGRIYGTVKTTPNTPVYRKVWLIRERDGLLMREQWSDPVTGVYDFKFVDELQKFTVLSYDQSGAFGAVVADGVVPVLMP